MADGKAPAGKMLVKKTVAEVKADLHAGELKRTLGPWNLISLGVGGIIGAGIFVMTGDAAANFAGPGVMLSFVIAGLACLFAGLCYAELASTIPVSGSAYSYAYVTLGEVFAWTMGWLLLLEFGVAASTVAAGWTSYVAGHDNNLGLLQLFGINIPEAIKTSTFQLQDGALQMLPQINLVGAFGIMAVVSLLVLGVQESAQVNNVIVAVKVVVLLTFVALGLAYIDPKNWTPFIPPNEGGFTYGIQGVIRAASIIFFAYVGFEAVATAAGEAKNPQRDLPIGILGSLLICTVLYMAVAAVMTGVVPFRDLAGGAGVAVAIDRMQLAWAQVPWPFTADHSVNLVALFIKIGAFTGLSSVMLVLIYAQTRIFYQMARDGLVPPVFSILHPKFRTPAVGTMLLGGVIALAASVLPLSVLGDLVSLGTALAFSIVCISVMYLRTHADQMERPFKVPFGGVTFAGLWWGVTPVLGVFFCVVLMMGPILFDIVSKAMGVDLLTMFLHGIGLPGFDSPGHVEKDPLALWILVVYALIGVAIYAFYGYRHSKTAHPGAASVAETPQS